MERVGLYMSRESSIRTVGPELRMKRVALYYRKHFKNRWPRIKKGECKILQQEVYITVSNLILRILSEVVMQLATCKFEVVFQRDSEHFFQTTTAELFQEGYVPQRNKVSWRFWDFLTFGGTRRY